MINQDNGKPSGNWFWFLYCDRNWAPLYLNNDGKVKTTNPINHNIVSTVSVRHIEKWDRTDPVGGVERK